MTGFDWESQAVSPEEAVSHIEDGAGVFLHGGAASALPLETALAERVRRFGHGINLYQLHKEAEEALAAPDLAGRARIHALFCGSHIRQAIAEGRAEYVPVFLSDIPHYIANRVFPIDVAILQVSPPDAHGYCSLGVSVDIARAAVDSAKVVIAEINVNMPRTHGRALVHLTRLTAFIATDRKLPEAHPAARTDVTDAIARHVASLVPDRATLQLGIGAIPDAVLLALVDREDLGVHTEMMSDGVCDLVARGVITNRYKPEYNGVCVTSFAVGTRKTYDFVDDNPAVLFLPSDVTNDTALIRKHPRMTAINSALQIDLTGQVVSDSLGTAIYSGIGGQMDFVRGAALAPDGKAILALPSTAKGGAISRIVPTLTEGAGVVTTRGHVQFVVTEHGVADLRGKGLRARADALVAIAHPDHRPELRRWLAGRRMYLAPALGHA